MQALQEFWIDHEEAVITAAISLIVVIVVGMFVRSSALKENDQKISELNVNIEEMQSELDKKTEEVGSLNSEITRLQRLEQEANRIEDENKGLLDRIRALEDENNSLKEDANKKASKPAEATKKTGVIASVSEKITLDNSMMSNIIIASTKLNGTHLKIDELFDAKRILLDNDERYEYDVDGETVNYVSGIEYIIEDLIKTLNTLSIKPSFTPINHANKHYIDSKSNLTFTNTTGQNIIILCTYSNQHLEIKVIGY